MSKSVKFIALSFSEGLNVLISFLLLPYLARAMAVVEYGSYGQTLMIGDLFKGLFACGLAKVIFAFLADKTREQNKTLYSNLIAAFGLGICCALIVVAIMPLVISQFQNAALNSTLWVYALAIPFQLAYSSLNAGLIYFDRVKESASIAVVTNLLRVGLIVLAIHFFSSLPLIFLSLILVAIVQIVLSYIYLPKHLRKSVRLESSYALDQIRSGWPLGIASIIGVLFWATDGLMVSSMLDVEQYAIYKNGAFQIPFLSSIYAVVTAVILPDVSRYFFEKDFDSIIKLKRRVISNVSVLMIPTIVFCIFFANSLIVIYLSERYAASAPVFMIYNIMLLARFTSYDDLFIASNNNKSMPAIYIMALCLNILLNYFFIDIWGIIGAALASVISFYMLIILLFYKGSSFVDAKPKQFLDWSKILPVFIIAVLCSAAFYLASNYMPLNALTMLIMLTVYLIICYHLILKRKLMDKVVLQSLLSRYTFTKAISRFIDAYY